MLTFKPTFYLASWNRILTSPLGVRGFPGGTVVRNSAGTRDARDEDLIPGLRGSPGVENGNTLKNFA